MPLERTSGHEALENGRKLSKGGDVWGVTERHREADEGREDLFLQGWNWSKNGLIHRVFNCLILYLFSHIERWARFRLILASAMDFFGIVGVPEIENPGLLSSRAVASK